MEDQFREFLKNLTGFDAAHDLAHTERVVKNAKMLLNESHSDSEIDTEITIAAAWLHDCVSLPKDHPDRKKSSVFAANKAAEFLEMIHFDPIKINGVKHAIEAHSFSSGIKPETLEAKIVQDADRLDALGAIGIARCFLVGGALNRPIYDPNDPFSSKRRWDDSKWTLDHFYSKLFNLPEQMNTDAAKKEAGRRVEFMVQYIDALKNEI